MTNLDETIDAVAAKLDALAEQLSKPERSVLAAMIAGDADDDVAGFSASRWPGTKALLGDTEPLGVKVIIYDPTGFRRP